LLQGNYLEIELVVVLWPAHSSWSQSTWFLLMRNHEAKMLVDQMFTQTETWREVLIPQLTMTYSVSHSWKWQKYVWGSNLMGAQYFPNGEVICRMLRNMLLYISCAKWVPEAEK
jgi:hypothetical protein